MNACKIEMIGRDDDLPKATRFLNRVITFREKGIDFEADQRLVEAIVAGLGLKEGNAATSPGTKSKPIPRSEQQKMMERRLTEEEGGNCKIANLKAQLGQPKKELKEMIERLKKTQGTGVEVEQSPASSEEGGANGAKG